jgi:hypothetical protein
MLCDCFFVSRPSPKAQLYAINPFNLSFITLSLGLVQLLLSQWRICLMVTSCRTAGDTAST